MAQDNRPITMFLNAKARKKQIPISGTFELSPVCNLVCKMCYVRKTPAETARYYRPMVTLAQWKQITEEAMNEGLLYLLLTGGEPFLWPDFRELYMYLIDKGLILSVNSNGTLISADTVHWMRCRPPSRVNITLYGASDAAYERLCGASGMYTKVSANIDRLLDAGIAVKLNASMTPYNATDMESIIRFAEDRDLPMELGTYMFPPVRRNEESIGTGDRFTPEEAAFYAMEYQRLTHSAEDYHRYLKQAAEGKTPPSGLDEHCVDPRNGTVRCQAGRAAFWITWDGWMTPCGMMPEPKADLIRYGFREAWQQTLDSTDGMRLSSVCENCAEQAICHCCASMAIAETGSSAGIPKYLCQMADTIRKKALEELSVMADNENSGKNNK